MSVLASKNPDSQNLPEPSLNDASDIKQASLTSQPEQPLPNQQIAQLQAKILELERTKQHYVELYEQSPIGDVTLSSEGAILACNRTFMTFVGLDKTTGQSAVGRSLASFLTPAAEPTFHAWIAALRQGEPRSSCVLELVAANHQPLRCQVQSATSLTAPLDAPHGIRLTFTVLMDELLPQSLDASESAVDLSHQAILDSLTAQIAVVNKHGVIIAVNTAWLQVTKYWRLQNTAGLGIGGNYYDVCRRSMESADPIAAQIAQLVLEGIQAVSAGTSDRFLHEYPIEVRAGEIVWYLLRVRPLTGSDGIVVVSHNDITEFKETQHALEQSRYFQERITMMIPDLLYIYDVDTRRNVYANVQFSETIGLGHSADNTASTAWLEQLAQAQTRRQARQQLAATETEFHLLDANGKRRWFSSREATFTQGPDGQVRQIVGIAREITEQREALEQLRKFSYAVEQNPVAILITDQAGIVEFANAQYTMLTGFGSAELYGKPPRLLDPAQTDPALVAERWERLHKGETWAGEVRTQDKKGNLLWEMVTIRPIFEASGTVGNLLIIKEDITDRKRSEEQLELYHTQLENEVIHRTEQLSRTKERVEAILNSSSDAIVLGHVHHGIQQTNPAFATLFACGPDFYLKQPITQLVHPEDAPRLDATIQAVMTQRTPAWLEARMLRPDGSSFDAEIGIATTSAYSQLGGQIVCTLRDITDRKVLERSLQESEGRFRAVLENAMDVAYRRNLVTDQYDYVSPVIEAITGYTVEEFLPLTFDQFIARVHPDDLEYAREETEQNTMNNDTRMDIEYRFRCKDGTYRWFADKATVVKDATGKPLYRVGIVRDVTTQTAILDTLLESEERFRSYFDLPLIGMATADSNMSFTLVNDKLCSMLGYNHESLITMQLLDVVIPTRAHLVALQIQSMLSGASDDLALDETFIHADGHMVHVSINARAVRRTDGTFHYAVILIQDISARKTLEQDLRVALEKEKELNELKTRFVSIVSHEFRTPLASIQLACDVLKLYSDRLSDEKRAQRFTSIQNDVRHMTTMLTEVLTLNQAEAGKLYAKLEAIEPTTFCEQLIASFQELVPMHHFVFHVKGMAYRCQLDPNFLKHMLTNLLTNAVKYSPQGSTITFTLEYAFDAVKFSVLDEGIGIPLEDQNHLFEAFHRATNVGQISGTGLGLTIVKEMVDLHGGQITLESTLGQGTTFTVSIPNALSTTTQEGT